MSFSTFGGAYLVPYANRIRGALSADSQAITAEWHGKRLVLPANWSGKNPGAERHSIHELFDDSFSGLVRANGKVVVSLIDPAAHYGLHIEGLSPAIKTAQFYAPKDKPFVALEEQYTFGDPFSKLWNGIDTGMVTLTPGQSTRWRVRLQLFTPHS